MNEETLITENEIIDTIKANLWSKTAMLWVGGISLSNWLGGVGANFAMTGTLNPATSLLGMVVDGASKLINLTILRTFAVVLVPTVLLGLIVHQYIRFNDVINIKNLEKELKNALGIIGQSKIFNKINTEFNEYLKQIVPNKLSPREKYIYAGERYIELLIEHAFPILIKKYISVYKENAIELSYIRSYRSLAQLDLFDSLILRNAADISDHLETVMLKYVHDEKTRQALYKKLDDVVLQEIDNAYVKEGLIRGIVDYFKNPEAMRYASFLISFMALSDIAVGTILYGFGTSAIYGSVFALYGAVAASVSVALLPFLIVVFGYAIYYSFDVSTVRAIVMITKDVTSLSKELKFDLSRVSLMEEYKKALLVDCKEYQKDKKVRAKCAVSKYLELFTNKVYIPLISKYIQYLKKHYQIDLSEDNVDSIFRLASLRSVPTTDSVVKLFRNVYKNYNDIIQELVKNDKSIPTTYYTKINNHIRSLQ